MHEVQSSGRLVQARRTDCDAEPVRPAPPARIKGRGAASNPEGRFEAVHHQAEDDGWQTAVLDAAALRPRTEVSAERARSVITHNDSPDIDFEAALNPYRGCEHGITAW